MGNKVGGKDLLERTFTKETKTEGKRTVTLLQFNVLAEHLSKDDFPEKPRTVIDWNNRKKNLIRVIVEHSPDVIALEECDHFNDWFKPQLSKLGYDGIFQAKLDKDGTAVFWSTKVFKMTNYKYYRYGTDSQGLVMVELTHTDNDQTGIFVGATHLKASHEFENKRKQQVDLLLEEFAQYTKDKKWPKFILGDFNDIPESSPIKSMEAVYTSAYDNKVENYWTTWKKREKEVKRIIDYIFYDKQYAIVTQVLRSPQNCPSHLPDTYYPSDHLAICAKFKYEE